MRLCEVHGRKNPNWKALLTIFTAEEVSQITPYSAAYVDLREVQKPGLGFYVTTGLQGASIAIRKIDELKYAAPIFVLGANVIKALKESRVVEVGPPRLGPLIVFYDAVHMFSSPNSEEIDKLLNEKLRSGFSSVVADVESETQGFQSL